MTDPQRQVAVVGAGAAGLAAAHELVRGGCRVDVYEAGPRPGGRFRTDELDGVRLDVHTQLFHRGDVATRRILEDAGAAGLWTPGPEQDALWRKGRARPVPYGSVSRMMTSGALPLRVKMVLGARYLPFLTRHGSELDLGRLDRAAGAGLDGESIAEWGCRELGSDFVDLVADPQLSAFFGARAGETTAGFYHALARQGVSLSLRVVRGGAGRWVEGVQAGIEAGSGRFHVETPVREVEAASDGVAVRTDEGTAAYDAAVIAIPAPAAADLLPAAPEAAREWLAGVRTRPMVTVGMALDRPVRADYFGLTFAVGESRTVAGVCVQERKGADLVPDGRGALVAYLLPETGERLADEAPDRVLEHVLPDLRLVFPDIESRLKRVRVYRWPHGATLFPPGSLARVRAFRDGAVEWDPRIRLAGDYLVAPTPEGAVRAGVRAAARLLEKA